jgi:gliding motility-associated-like protein
LQDPPAVDSFLPGVWKLIIPKTSIDSVLFNIRPFGFDKANQYLYSLIHQRITRYDLKNGTVSVVNATNWPGDFTEFVFDYTNNRLLCWRGGRDSVYALPANGGSWTAIGPGSIDRESLNASSYWNPITKQPGFYGGYGYNQVKSWIFENNGTTWLQRKSNPPIDTLPPKGGNLLAANADGTQLYLFSGQGNYSGDELSGSCTLGSPWATASGMYCWLRDLWKLDLNTYTFTNLFPVNSASIQNEGAFGYDYDKGRFYIFGGYQPTGNNTANQNLARNNQTFRYRLNKDNAFTSFVGEGTLPPAVGVNASNGYAYYDAIGKRMIWARYDGIWAYYPDSTLVPVSLQSYQWSTGETTASITVKPSASSSYIITRTYGGQVCVDSIRVTIPVLKTALQPVLKICADSVVLDAGTGFNTYQWNTGAAAQTITVKKSSTYRVTVGQGSCQATDTTQVQIASALNEVILRNQLDSICPAEPDSVFVTNPQAGVNYSWYLPGNPNPIDTGPYHVVLNAKNNTDLIVQATSNPPVCPAKAANTKIIIRTQLVKPTLKADTALLTPFAAAFRWDAIAGSTGYEVKTETGQSTVVTAPGFVQPGLQPNTPLKLIVRTLGRFACETSDTVSLRVITLNPFGDGIYIPTAITPNGDGVNDELHVYATALVSLKLMVYNAWGAQVFMTTDLSKGWDGTDHGKPQPAGLYTYALEAVMQDGKKINKTGTFSLLR